MSSNILVLAEHNNGVFVKTAYELLSKAKELSGSLGGQVCAVVIGDADGASLGNYGADKVYSATGEGFQALNTGVATKAVQAAIEACSPKLLLGAASSAGRDILPRLAIRLNAGFAPELVELAIQDGVLVGTRPSFTGKVYHDVRVSTDLQIFSVRPNAFSVEAVGGSAEVESLSVELSDFDTSFTVTDVQVSEVQYVDLTEADRIVSGGRSVKSKESFDSLIRPLAKVLGATAGASRAAVDAGFAEHSEQVGQTGKIVNPSLYIACGISGAIQHLAGMRTSRVIVAINQDKDAPIFSHATYGIVADMFEVCPELTNALSGQETVSDSKPKAAPAATEAPQAKKEEAPTPVAEKKEEAPAPVAEKKEEAPKVAAAAPAAAVPATAAPSTGVVAAFDPSVLDGLKSEIAKLSSELSATQSKLNKAIADSEKSLKAEVQRTEKNARAFQDGGFKRFDKVENVVAAEVRKVREVLRKGISNDTQDLRDGINAIRSTAIAAVVVNILVLFLLGLMMATH